MSRVDLLERNSVSGAKCNRRRISRLVPRIVGLFICATIVFGHFKIEAAEGSELSNTQRSHMPPAVPRSLAGGFWRTDHAFAATLQVKNILVNEQLQITPVLYMADGTEYDLSPRILAAAESASINITDALKTAPPQIAMHISEFGSAEIRFTYGWNALAAHIQNLDVPRSLIYREEFAQSVPVQPVKSGHQVLEGLWWRHDASTGGFLALANTSASPLHVHVQPVSAAGNPGRGQIVDLSPHATVNFDLAELLVALPYVTNREGGIVVSFEGSENDLTIAGGNENANIGFSSPMYFRFIHAKEMAMNNQVASVGIMVGEQDAMMGFPKDTRFAPYAFIRNVLSKPLTMTASIHYFSGATALSLDMPSLRLGPKEARSLDIASLMSSGGVRNYNGTIHVSFKYSGDPNGLLVAVGSVDQTGTYVFDVPAREVNPSSSRTVSYFSTANGFDTMFTLWNPSSQAEDLQITFATQAGNYQMPVHLDANGTSMLSLSELATQHKADTKGHFFPVNAVGTAEITSAKGRPEQFTVVLDAGTYNVQSATCNDGGCNCGVYITDVSEYLVPWSVFRSASVQEHATAYYSDGSQGDVTTYGDWWTGSTSIATVSSGIVSGVAPGTSYLTYQIYVDQFPAPQCWDETCCEHTFADDSEQGGVNDPTPNITGVDPNPWNAGTAFMAHIYGSGFGSSPQVSISDTYGAISYQQPSGGTDTEVDVPVSISADVPAENVTITVTSRGANGQGFVCQYSCGSQPTSPSFDLSVNPIPAPAPQINFFGTAISAPLTVYVGQQISLSATVNVQGGVAISTQSWTVPGTAVAGFSGSATGGEQITQLLNFGNYSMSFYWLTAGTSGQSQYQVVYSYCLVNGNCRSATATFNLFGPSSVNPNVTTTNVNVFNNATLGNLMAYQTAVNPTQPGIRFIAQATLPSGNQGSYQWIQLINSDKTQYLNPTPGTHSCTSFTGTAGISELDNTYPYGNVTPSTVSTTSVPSDTAVDSPNSGLPSTWGEVQRAFNATMYLEWIPSADSRCTSGSACTIPVPLGQMIWSWEGDSINTQQTQPAPNGTKWALSCSTNRPGAQVTFSPSNISVSNNFGYSNWQNVAGGCN